MLNIYVLLNTYNLYTRYYIYIILSAGADLVREWTAHGRQAKRTLFAVSSIWGKLKHYI